MAKSQPENKNFISMALGLLLAVFFIGSCSKKREYVTIAYGYSENPRSPMVAFEINPDGHCYYVTVSEDEVSSYYSSKISVKLAKDITNFVKIRMDSIYSLSSLQNRDATIAEYKVYQNKEILGGYRYLTQGKDSDSIKYFINAINKSPDLKSIPFHKFQTTIQNQKLPTPPPPPEE